MHINISEDKHRIQRKQKILNRLWRHRIPLFLISLLLFIITLHHYRKQQSNYAVYPNSISEQQLQQLALDNYSYGRHNPNRRVVYNNKTPIKAALVIMASENELIDIHATMTDVEDRFNQEYGYPWIILSDHMLSERFQRIISTAPSRRNSENIYFGLIPPYHWNEPAWIDIKEAEKAAVDMANRHIFHGESISWRKAVRYNAGLLAHHPLLQDAEYYWKVQPRSRLLCDMNEDPFQSMKANDQKLAFAISMKESHLTVPTLWQSVQEYVRKEMKDEYSAASLIPPSDSIFPWIIDKNRPTTNLLYALSSFSYNYNHIWNNFMIISLDFLRSAEYQRFFHHMDLAGGFFYERWSDGPVQTIAAALYLRRHQVRFMENIGYSFSVAVQCPTNETIIKELRCTCDPRFSFLERGESETKKLLKLQQEEPPSTSPGLF